MKRFARPLLLVLVLAALAWYVWRARGEFRAILSQIDPAVFWPLLPLMVAVPLASLWINAQISRDLVAEFGVRLGQFEAYALSTVNALGNYMPVPQAGAMARGVYLKRVHGLAYTTYAATVVVTYVSSLALTGLAGLAGLLALHLTGHPAPWQLWVAFAGLSGSLLMFTPIGRHVPLPKKLARFSEGLATLRAHRVLAKIVVLQLALIAVTATGLFLSARALPGGASVTWATALMLGLISMVAAVVNVLGVEQVAAMACAATLGISPALGLAASALFRLVAIAVVFTTGPMIAHWLSKRAASREGGAPSEPFADAARGAPAARTEPRPPDCEPPVPQPGATVHP
ncbi:MAG TPA: lysylphosphatidylglycerol synthase domain-containing protein [Tepidisphaeraceae bacterium]|nr:lysylphosphatidylglycerol synthase domain-containing protein [Tepidisphaeraceae bacterium]